MVVPLETLAGWPEAQPPTVLQTLGLLIGIPLLVFLWCRVPKIVTNIHASRGTGLPPIETLWVGGKDGPVDIEPTPDEARALESGPPEAADQTGGAGARW